MMSSTILKLHNLLSSRAAGEWECGVCMYFYIVLSLQYAKDSWGFLIIEVCIILLINLR
jgi:hypothetical protein